MKPDLSAIEALAAKPEILSFARKWVKAYDEKAFDESVEFVKLEPDEWIAAIVAIARETEDDKRHDPNLAAGLLEDFLGRHGEEYLQPVSDLARRWPRFRYLLGGVWRGSMKKGVWHQIEAIRGNPW